MTAWWVVAAVVFALGEILTTTLFVGPFAIGALAAMAVALAGGPVWLQFVLFFAGSAVAFTVVRPIARRHRSMPPQIRTGTAALIGRQAVVLEEVTDHGGLVKLEGEVWTARPYDAEDVLPEGARVHVMEIQGATALVAE
jgi:membrane protein implicated in regulation of membrane protease activity